MVGFLQAAIARFKSRAARKEGERAQVAGNAEHFRAMSGLACYFMIRHAGVEPLFGSQLHPREFEKALELLDGKNRVEVARAGGLHAIARGQFGDHIGCVGFGWPSFEVMETLPGPEHRIAVMELLGSLSGSFRALGEEADADACDARYADAIDKLQTTRPPPPWLACLFEADSLWGAEHNKEAIATLEKALSTHQHLWHADQQAAGWVPIIEARLRTFRAYDGGSPEDVLAAAQAEADFAWKLPKANFDLAPQILLAAIEFILDRGGDAQKARGLACRALGYSTIARTPQALRWRVLKAAMRMASSQAEAILFGKLAIAEVMDMRVAITSVDRRYGEAETGPLGRLFAQVVKELVEMGRIAEAGVLMSLRRQKEISPFQQHERSGLYRERALLAAPEGEAAMLYYVARNRQDEAEISTLLREMGAMIAEKVQAAAERQQALQALTKDSSVGLDASTAMLQIMPGSEFTTILLSFADGQMQHRSHLAASSINRFVFAALQKIRAVAERNGLDELQTLHDELIAWALPQLDSKGIKRLVISTSGALQSLPFGTLHNGRAWLSERFTIVRAPVDAALLEAVPRSVPTMFVGGTARGEEGICGPLPHVLEELDRIRAIGDGILVETELAVEGRFTAERVLAALKERDVIVLGAHCIGEPLSPRKSRLLLGGGGAIALEALALPDIRPDLIVLSACETGSAGSPLTPGLDLSVDRLLTLSGARSILSTAWRIHDESQSILMPQFFANLLVRGMAKDDALAQAQRAMIQGELRAEDGHIFSAPYYWAAPMLTGNWLGFAGLNSRGG